MVQGLTDMLKRHLLDYGKTYFNLDYKLPESGVLPIRVFPVNFDFFWTNFRHDDIKIDIDRFAFNFTHHFIDGEDPLVITEIPLVEEFNIAFDYEYKLWFRTKRGSADILMKNVTAYASTSLRAKENGLLAPHFTDLVVDFTDTKLSTPSANWLRSWWYRQWFNVGKYVTMNALKTFGPDIFNLDIGSMWATHHNNQKKHFKWGVP